MSLICDYSGRTVVMAQASEVPEVDDPARYDLCSRHAARFRPPHGWELVVDAGMVDAGINDAPVLAPALP